MSDAKWTKGPWFIDRNDSVKSGDHSTVKVTGVSLAMYQSDEVAANTNLIAAAPELYEALERMLDEFGQSAIQDMTITSVLSQAEHALTKARGEM